MKLRAETEQVRCEERERGVEIAERRKVTTKRLFSADLKRIAGIGKAPVTPGK